LFGNKLVRNEETDAGINEHAFDFLDYWRAFRTAGLRARFVLPGAVEGVLREATELPEAGRVKSLLLGLAPLLWRVPPLRALLRSSSVNLVGLLFLEYGLTAVAQKPLEGERV
jgi:hypothetical protein